MSETPMDVPGSPQRGSGCARVLAIVGAAVVALVVAFGLAGWFAFRRFTWHSKVAESTATLGSLARGLEECVRDGRGPAGWLPPSAGWAPAGPPPRGRPVSPTPTDWDAPAWRCAGFSPAGTQWFRYHWEVRDEGRAGTLRAEADLDGDGVPEVVRELELTCREAEPGYRECTRGALRDLGRTDP